MHSCPKGHKLEAAQVGVRGPGARLTGTMARDPTSGVYTVTSENEAGESSILISDDTNAGLVRKWNWVDLVLETYNVDDCAQYSSGGAMRFLDMTLTDVEGAAVTPTFEMAPYIDGRYLPPAEARAFTACCHGQFTISWPHATMAQNAKAAAAAVAAEGMVERSKAAEAAQVARAAERVEDVVAPEVETAVGAARDCMGPGTPCCASSEEDGAGRCAEACKSQGECSCGIFARCFPCSSCCRGEYDQASFMCIGVTETGRRAGGEIEHEARLYSRRLS